MTELVLNDDQLELVTVADGPVIVRDRNGTDIGILSPVDRKIRLSGEELDSIQSRMTGDPSTFPTFREAIERIQTRTES